jgi:hypothetical protein
LAVWNGSARDMGDRFRETMGGFLARTILSPPP